VKPPAFDPCVECEPQFVPIAPVFGDFPAGTHRGDIETALNVLAVDNLVALSRNHDDSLVLPVPNDWRDLWLNRTDSERCQLFAITSCQSPGEELLHFLDGCRLPLIH